LHTKCLNLTIFPIDCWPGRQWDTNNNTTFHPQESLPVAALPNFSLRSQAERKLLDQFLSGDETDVTLLNYPKFTPGSSREMVRHLSEHAEALAKSPVALQILEKAFATEILIDFSPFQAMPATIIRALLHSDFLMDVKVLNISGIDAVSNNEVDETLGAIKKDLNELYLLVQPAREADYPLQELAAITNTLESRLFPQKLMLGSAFSRGLRKRPWLKPFERETFDQRNVLGLSPDNKVLWSAFPVIQLLYKYIKKPVYFDEKEERSTIFLGDAFLTPIRFVTGLIQVLRTRILQTKLNTFSIELNLTLNFASAPSSLKYPKSIGK